MWVLETIVSREFPLTHSPAIGATCPLHPFSEARPRRAARSPTRRRKSAASVHAGAAAIRSLPGTAPRVGRDMLARDRVVENLAKDVQHPVRPVGRRSAVGIEPPHHHDAADSVEAHRAEGGQQLALPVRFASRVGGTAYNGRSRRSARGRRRTPGTEAPCPERSPSPPRRPPFVVSHVDS